MDTITRKTPTLETVKKALSTDWLARDGGSLVYQRSTGRLDWEKSLPSGSAYSEEFLALDGARGHMSDEQILGKAYGMAMTILNTLDIKGSVNLRFNPHSDDSYTNGKTVTVSTQVLDDKTVDITHRLDILLGTTEHEGLHCEFTDFKVHSSDEILQDLVNIVEDERIEHCAGEKYPGLANFLKEFKYYYFNLYRTRNRKELDAAPYSGRLINAIIALIRYPKALTDGELTEFGEYLIEIRKVLSSFPGSTAESMVFAQKIYDIIKDAVSRQPKRGGGKKKGSDGDSSESDSGSSAGSGNEKKEAGKGTENTGKDGKEGEENGDGSSAGQEKEGDDGKKTGKESEGTGKDGEEGKKEEKKDGEGTENAGNDGNDEGDKEQGGGGIGADDSDVPDSGKNGGEKKIEDGETPEFEEKEYRELTPEEVNKALDVIRRTLRTFRQDTDSNNQTCKAVQDNPRIDQLCRGEAERGQDSHVLFLKVQDNAEAEMQYAADLNAVRPFIPAMKNILVAHATRNVYRLKGMKTGRLDGGKLAQAFIGSPNVHLQRKEVKSGKIAVCILVDESGSMWGPKILAARRTAILLNEALGSVPNVDLFIYGHTDSRRSIEIRIYREHGVCNRYAIGRMEARNGNADGYAILETARRVREQTQEKVLFFVISDGAPACHLYNGNSGITHTREAVKKVTAQGFFPVQIAIEPHCDPATMFSHYVRFTDLSELPRTLTAMVKKAVLSNTERK